MWHEARRSERKVHDMMDAARKRAQRRAMYLAKRRGDPQQSIQAVGSRCRIHRDDAIFQATEDQQGLIPWNGKQDVLIDRFDGRALLDFIRESSSRRFRVPEKTEEEEELEEFVNFERYRDLIKHRRRGFTDEEGLQHVNQEMGAKIAAAFGSERPHVAQPPPNKGSYSQVSFSYDGDGQEDFQYSDGEEDDDEDEDEEEDFNSDDSNDEAMESIAKEFGVKRYGWLLYMDKKAKEEARRQKEVIKGDPSIRKLSRKERRKASQIEREREREAARVTGTRVLHHDPYRDSRRSPTYEAYSRSRRSRSRSRSYSPSQSRRYSRGVHPDDTHRSKDNGPKIEYITEFGSSGNREELKLEGYSPPQSPPSQIDALSRPTSGLILEALHVDPASGVSLDKDRKEKLLKTTQSTSSALAKLNKTTCSGSLSKQQGEKKETPQERLKRIMSKQLNKQIKKDTAVEMAKKREQERKKLEKLAETSRVSRYQRRSRSRSNSQSPRRYRRSRSPSREGEIKFGGRSVLRSEHSSTQPEIIMEEMRQYSRRAPTAAARRQQATTRHLLGM
ncbi:CLK4-associating serine/arginine-rich protein [Perilla frutescens var. hirtella]|uniref:CLK4-associating serine/arginine-rich protein n=1 Tax=Perilla frutescens var. hirtella TaxID=608512 RepID=A0AAD4JQD9_PERFH|nr:CLK4-associating serine/arginine-rich protein [Perilla frutescens var. hirtella]